VTLVVLRAAASPAVSLACAYGLHA